MKTNSPQEGPKTNQGSYENWDKVWRSGNEDIELFSQFVRDRNFKNIYQFWQKVYASDLLSLISGRNYTAFLELGAGKGTTSMYLRDAGYHDITLVDLSKEGEKLANQLFEFYGFGKPNYVIDDVEKTLLKSGHYDCIYNIGLLEHFEDPIPTLVETFRLLRNDGLIFMPIIPDQPYYKSLLCRLFLNPISVVKYFVKLLVERHKKSKGQMVRTTHGRRYYEKICIEIGFKNVRCIPYNPYWKVNKDPIFERKITLFLYDLHYRLFKKGSKVSMKTWPLTNLCYLLLAEK